MKMKKLASIINPMSEQKSLQAATSNNEGIGDKAIGFAQFASPKKGNGRASVGIDGFAQIVNKNKQSRSANVGRHDVFAQDVAVGGDKSDIAKCANEKKRSRPASAGDGDGYAPISRKTKEGLEFTKNTIEKAGYTDKGATIVDQIVSITPAQNYVPQSVVQEKFERLCEEQMKAGINVDKNAVFLEAAGGFDKKKRVYGIGSSQDLFYRPETVPCSSSFANVENHKLREELKAMKDKMNKMENQIAKILEANSFPRGQSQSPTSDEDSHNGDE